MLKWKKTTLEIIVFGILMLNISSSRATSDATYNNLLSVYLEMGPAVHLNIDAHGRSAAEIDEILMQIYSNNDFQLFWIKDGKTSQAGRDIRTVLQDAGSQGLNPEDYLLSNINKFWTSTDNTGQAKLDIILTLGMMLYVADQREGRIQPRQLDPKLFATASDVEVDWQALFNTAFETSDMKSFLAEQAPPFFQYRQLQRKLAEYRMIAQKGGWPSVPDGDVLKPGMVDPRMSILRERLAVTGESLTESLEESPTFDPPLVDAVKKFQQRHNLLPDGVVGKQTLAAMNIPAELRIQQIIINMERYRWLKRLKDEQVVAVNIAGFQAVAGSPGKFDITMPVIVGRTYHKTPVFNDTIRYVEFNPYWNVPTSIARNEILPKLQKDPSYLKKQNMRIFRGWEEDSAELDAMKIDWQKVSKKEMNRYRVRQDPGPKNALGTLKIMFPNTYHVYLHDTPAHGLFKEEMRAFSHGCIRMARPAEMAAYVLGGGEKGWSVERVDEIVATGKRQVVTLDEPMPVYILYRTVVVDPEDDTLYFYNDIYGRDKLLAQALLGADN
jgi:murein L,D-transpeptidase YcbB/YkuD